MNGVSGGYQVKGLLVGFGALYAIFFIGCLALFWIVLRYVPIACLQPVLLILIFLVLLALIVYAMILQWIRPDTFTPEWISSKRNIKDKDEAQGRSTNWKGVKKGGDK